MEKRNKFKVRIVFKSGYVYEDWFYSFNTKRNGSDLVEISWQLVDGSNKQIVFISCDEIAAVIQLEVK